jgi:membrane protein
MTWIWISTMVVLVGAKINAEIEKQTGVDASVATRKECLRTTDPGRSR